VSAFRNPIKDPELAPDLAKIKTKLCDANVRPSDTQWTAIQKCDGLDKLSDEDIKKVKLIMITYSIVIISKLM
jgi:hypothetical protein